MNNTNRSYIIAGPLFTLAALITLATGCTKNINEFNTNEKAASVVPATALFLNGEKNLSDALSSTSVSQAPFRVLAQSWTENTYVSEAQYNLLIDNSPQGWWNLLYANSTTSVLNSLAAAKAALPLQITDQAVLRNDLIITDILEVYAFSLLVNTYGNIPYSQALNRLIPFPKYDDAKTVYSDLLTRLDTAIAGLNTGAASFGASDQIYKGDAGQWKKFAATLKLKLSLVIADTDPVTAAKKVQEAVTTGVFASNSDNAVLVYDASATTDSNPVYQALVAAGRHDFSPADLLVSTLVGWNDPRLPLYYKQYNGGYLGAVPGAGNGYVKFSQLSDQWLNATWPGDLLDDAETEFLLAEAVERGIAVAGTAESHYDNAVTASIKYWGGKDADAAAYLAQPSVAYSTAAGSWKQKIGYQKWIALADRGWDAWTEIRRLGYPNLDAVNPPVAAIGNLPRRFTYPGNEQSSNPTNWADAVKAVNGGAADQVSVNLWWNH
jgi:hypothetical protein